MTLMERRRSDGVALMLALLPLFFAFLAVSHFDLVKEGVPHSVARIALALGIFSALAALGMAVANFVRGRLTPLRAFVISAATAFLIWGVPYGIGVVEALLSRH